MTLLEAIQKLAANKLDIDYATIINGSNETYNKQKLIDALNESSSHVWYFAPWIDTTYEYVFTSNGAEFYDIEDATNNPLVRPHSVIAILKNGEPFRNKTSYTGFMWNKFYYPEKPLFAEHRGKLFMRPVNSGDIVELVCQKKLLPLVDDADEFVLGTQTPELEDLVIEYAFAILLGTKINQEYTLSQNKKDAVNNELLRIKQTGNLTATMETNDTASLVDPSSIPDNSPYRFYNANF